MIDHFCRFGIDRTFAVDRDRLERLFHELQSQSHPDRHVTSGDERRDQALAESSDINSAYRLLREPLQRARHLVELYGYAVGNQKNIPSTLLMTVMEAQEKIAELEQARGREENEKLIHELSAVAEELEMRRETIDDERRAIAKQWDVEMHADSTDKLSDKEKELLGRMSQLLAERAYLETLHLSVKAAQHGRPAFIQH
jgi:Fe-S protein assembly co-chaperone HscB